MIIEETENADLDFETKHFDRLKNGIVIFPESLNEIEKIEQIKLFLKNILELEPCIDHTPIECHCDRCIEKNGWDKGIKDD
jgi:hypothetical protein